MEALKYSGEKISNLVGSAVNCFYIGGGSSIDYLLNKEIKPEHAIATGLTLAMLYSPFAIKNADAEGLNLMISKDKVAIKFSLSHDLFGGNSKKYKAKSETLESQVAGLNSNPNISRDNSESYYRKHTGNQFTKLMKELAHGATSIVHPYNTKTNGSKRCLPGISTLTKEGSIFAPITGLIAYPVNTISKLFGSDFRMYNAWKQNGWRTLGTALTEVGIYLAVSSDDKDRGSGGNIPVEEEPIPEVPIPEEEPVPEEPIEDPGGSDGSY